MAMPMANSKIQKKHYHVVYKEILAVKYDIQKFEFHFIGHRFLVWLDKFSFLNILNLKNKSLTNNQLIHLK